MIHDSNFNKYREEAQNELIYDGIHSIYSLLKRNSQLTAIRLNRMENIMSELVNAANKQIEQTKAFENLANAANDRANSLQKLADDLSANDAVDQETIARLQEEVNALKADSATATDILKSDDPVEEPAPETPVEEQPVDENPATEPEVPVDENPEAPVEEPVVDSTTPPGPNAGVEPSAVDSPPVYNNPDPNNA